MRMTALHPVGCRYTSLVRDQEQLSAAAAAARRQVADLERQLAEAEARHAEEVQELRWAVNAGSERALALHLWPRGTWRPLLSAGQSHGSWLSQVATVIRPYHAHVKVSAVHRNRLGAGCGTDVPGGRAAGGGGGADVPIRG